MALLLATGWGCNLTAPFLSPTPEVTATPPPAPTAPVSEMTPLEYPVGGYDLTYPAGWVAALQQGAIILSHVDPDIVAMTLAASPADQWEAVWPQVDAILASAVFYAPHEATPEKHGNLQRDVPTEATLKIGGVDEWTYCSPGDEYVAIDVAARGDWDPFLEVLNPAGDPIALEGAEGDLVTISMVGVGQMDTSLELYGPDGTMLIADDDSGEDYAALIADYALPQAGVYRIVGRSLGEPGPYTLSLTKK